MLYLDRLPRVGNKGGMDIWKSLSSMHCVFSQWLCNVEIGLLLPLFLSKWKSRKSLFHNFEPLKPPESSILNPPWAMDQTMGPVTFHRIHKAPTPAVERKKNWMFFHKIFPSQFFFSLSSFRACGGFRVLTQHNLLVRPNSESREVEVWISWIFLSYGEKGIQDTPSIRPSMTYSTEVDNIR